MFFQKWKQWNRWIIFNILFTILFMNRYHIGHFGFSWEDFPPGFHIALSQICNMQMWMLIRACPYALFRFNSLITLKISSSVRFIIFKDSFVLRNIWVIKSLPALIWVQCFAGNDLIIHFFIWDLRQIDYYELKQVYREFVCY